MSKILYRKLKTGLLTISIILIATACKDSKRKIITTQIFPIHIERFDRHLPEYVSSEDSVFRDNFRKKYSPFFSLYCQSILKLSPETAPEYLPGLKRFVSDTAVKVLYADCENEYSDMSDLENNLSEAFGRYGAFFPEYKVPRILSHVSGLGVPVIIADSLISVSIDNYLGSDYRLYKGLFYDYELKSKIRRQIPLDIISAVIYTEEPFRKENATLLDHIVYEGAVIYLLEQIFPDKKEEDLLGFSQEQLNWCRKNESKIWNKMVREKHLFSGDMLLQNKYLNPAPFTSPLTAESPGRTGRWIGYQLVKAYLRNVPEANITDIIRQDMANTVLKQSKYKG